ncbi:MAG: MBL fold metallo-hydrolase, partial [Halobacteriota archaeon]
SNETTSESEQTTTERDDETMSQSDQSEGAADGKEADGESAMETGGFTFEIDPAIRALTEQRATTESGSVDGTVYDTVERYLAEIVGGREPWTGSEGLIERQFDVEADAAFEQLLAAGAESTGAQDIESFVLQRVCSSLEFDQTDRTISVESVEPLAELMDAAVKNEDCPHDTRDELVQAALETEVL